MTERERIEILLEQVNKRLLILDAIEKRLLNMRGLISKTLNRKMLDTKRLKIQKEVNKIYREIELLEKDSTIES